jgi:hypothetical protein
MFCSYFFEAFEATMQPEYPSRLNTYIQSLYDALLPLAVCDPPTDFTDIDMLEQHLRGLNAHCSWLEYEAVATKRNPDDALVLFHQNLLLVAGRYALNNGIYPKIEAAYLASFVASRPANGNTELRRKAISSFDKTIAIIDETFPIQDESSSVPDGNTLDPKQRNVFLARALFCPLLLPTPEPLATRAQRGLTEAMSNLIPDRTRFFAQALADMSLQASAGSSAIDRLLEVYNQISSQLEPFAAVQTATIVAHRASFDDGLTRLMSAAAHIFDSNLCKLIGSPDPDQRQGAANYITGLHNTSERLPPVLREIGKERLTGALSPTTISGARRNLLTQHFH